MIGDFNLLNKNILINVINKWIKNNQNLNQIWIY